MVRLGEGWVGCSVVRLGEGWVGCSVVRVGGELGGVVQCGEGGGRARWGGAVW